MHAHHRVHNLLNPVYPNLTLGIPIYQLCKSSEPSFQINSHKTTSIRTRPKNLYNSAYEKCKSLVFLLYLSRKKIASQFAFLFILFSSWLLSLFSSSTMLFKTYSKKFLMEVVSRWNKFYLYKAQCFYYFYLYENGVYISFYIENSYNLIYIYIQDTGNLYRKKLQLKGVF